MSGTFSEFLNLLELRGASWCVAEMGVCTGFSLPQNEALFFYAALEGSVRIAGIAGGVINLEPGGVALILSGETHAVRNHPSARTDAIEYLRDGDYGDTAGAIRIGDGGPVETRLLCGRLKVRWPSGVVCRSLPARAVLDAGDVIVAPGALERATVGTGSAALLTRIASLLLTHALRGDPGCEQLFLSSAARNPIARALQLMDRHYNQPLTVAILARNVGMGRSNFAARFTREVGRTPMKALAERRIQAAAELLQADELKIAEVAARVGYASEAAFSHCFVDMLGMTPGRMRSEAAKRNRQPPAPGFPGAQGTRA